MRNNRPKPDVERADDGKPPSAARVNVRPPATNPPQPTIQRILLSPSALVARNENVLFQR